MTDWIRGETSWRARARASLWVLIKILIWIVFIWAYWPSCHRGVGWVFELFFPTTEEIACDRREMTEWPFAACFPLLLRKLIGLLLLNLFTFPWSSCLWLVVIFSVCHFTFAWQWHTKSKKRRRWRETKKSALFNCLRKSRYDQQHTHTWGHMLDAHQWVRQKERGRLSFFAITLDCLFDFRREVFNRQIVLTQPETTHPSFFSLLLEPSN